MEDFKLMNYIDEFNIICDINRSNSFIISTENYLGHFIIGINKYYRRFENLELYYDEFRKRLYLDRKLFVESLYLFPNLYFEIANCNEDFLEKKNKIFTKPTFTLRLSRDFGLDKKIELNCYSFIFCEKYKELIKYIEESINKDRELTIFCDLDYECIEIRGLTEEEIAMILILTLYN